VNLAASISDVLGGAQGADYYMGELQASFDVRLTDLRNGDPATDAATVADLPLQFKLPCVVDVTVGGSTCAATTSADAIAAGSVVEGGRAIWELGPVRIYDGGADGLATTADNTLFATQGLFVP
jgi:hypothetical protein